MEHIKSELRLLKVRNDQLEDENQKLESQIVRLKRQLNESDDLNSVLENIKIAQSECIDALNQMVAHVVESRDDDSDEMYNIIQSKVENSEQLMRHLLIEYDDLKKKIHQPDNGDDRVQNDDVQNAQIYGHSFDKVMNSNKFHNYHFDDGIPQSSQRMRAKKSIYSSNMMPHHVTRPVQSHEFGTNDNAYADSNVDDDENLEEASNISEVIRGIDEDDENSVGFENDDDADIEDFDSSDAYDDDEDNDGDDETDPEDDAPDNNGNNSNDGDYVPGENNKKKKRPSTEYKYANITKKPRIIIKNKSFRMKSPNSEHMSGIHAKKLSNDRYKCCWDGCGFISSYKQNVDRHFRVHTGERPFKCTFDGCGFAATQAGNLKVHQQRHHLKSSHKEDSMDSPGEREQSTEVTDFQGSDVKNIQ